MTVLNLNEKPAFSGSGEARPVLPTDIYRMRIIDSKMEDDTFAKPEADGTFPQKLAITFEVSTLTEEQQEAADEAGEEWDEVRIWHRFNPYYGTIKAGGPSKFKEFIDNLIEWKLIAINLGAFDVTALVGIELRCSVVKYNKTMGANVGKPGNKITAFSPVKKARAGKNVAEPVSVDAPQAVDEDADLF